MEELSKVYQHWQVYIHDQNVERGWWDNPRSFSVFTNLFHSEVSEGVEGLRRNLMDDKLPQYKNLHVELVDCFIRILDYLGHKHYTWPLKGTTLESVAPLMESDIHFNIAQVHYLLSQAWWYSHNTLGVQPLVPDYRTQRRLAQAALLCHCIVLRDGGDFLEILEAKVAFNKVRKDHSREARAALHGKGF